MPDGCRRLIDRGLLAAWARWVAEYREAKKRRPVKKSCKMYQEANIFK